MRVRLSAKHLAGARAPFDVLNTHYGNDKESERMKAEQY